MSEENRDNFKSLYESGQFDPRVYIRTFYTQLDDEEMFFMDCYHYMFSKKLVKGAEMLDLGTGPMMHTMISASAFVQKITLSDFIEENRRELKKWLQDDPDKGDFRFLYEHVARLENSDVEKLERRVRSKVTDVIHCDVTLSNPLTPLVAQYDVIVSNLCLEAAVTTRDQYARTVVNVASLVKPNGYLLLSGSLGCVGYYLGKSYFKMVNLTQEVIEEALLTAGFRTLFWMILPKDPQSAKITAEFTHCFALAAQKVAGTDH